MVDPMSSATAAAFTSLKAVAGVPITYQRGASSVSLTAVPASTTIEVADDEGAIIKSRIRDFLIRASELIIDGSAVLPERGDQIVETVGDYEYTREVLGPAGDQPFRFWDKGLTVFRIHTVLIDRTTTTEASTTTTSPV